MASLARKQWTTWDEATDQWSSNVLFRRLTAQPEKPRARHIKRKPVSVRAIRRHRLSELGRIDLEADQPIDLDPAWSIAQTIEYWRDRL